MIELTILQSVGGRPAVFVFIGPSLIWAQDLQGPIWMVRWNVPQCDIFIESRSINDDLQLVDRRPKDQYFKVLEKEPLLPGDRWKKLVLSLTGEANAHTSHLKVLKSRFFLFQLLKSQGKSASWFGTREWKHVFSHTFGDFVKVFFFHTWVCVLRRNLSETQRVLQDWEWVRLFYHKFHTFPALILGLSRNWLIKMNIFEHFSKNFEQHLM